MEVGGDAADLRAEKIVHLDIEKAVYRTKRPACNGANVLLELAGHAGFRRPVTGICLLYTSDAADE